MAKSGEKCRKVGKVAESGKKLEKVGKSVNSGKSGKSREK